MGGREGGVRERSQEETMDICQRTEGSEGGREGGREGWLACSHDGHADCLLRNRVIEEEEGREGGREGREGGGEGRKEGGRAYT